MTLQRRADEGQDKHGLRSEPATEDEKARRITEMEAENAALHSRLEFTSCQKADVEAQVLELEEQNAALRQDAAVGRAVIKGARFGMVTMASIHSSLWVVKYREDSDPPVYREAVGNSPKAALAAAGLMEEEGK